MFNCQADDECGVLATGCALPRHRARPDRQAVLLLARNQCRHHEASEKGASRPTSLSHSRGGADRVRLRLLQLLDYDAARTKLRKLQEKAQDDPVKLPRAEKEEEDAREIFEVLDAQLRNDLPLILELRVPYLDPSFECMVSHLAWLCFTGRVGLS